MTDGERWTREVLDRLRAAHFAPGAWFRFLGASFERARAQRSIHRRAHAQTLALGAVGLAGWVLVWAAGRPLLALLGAAWWVLIALMLDWHLGMLDRPDGRPLTGLGVANAVTAARGGAIPVFVALDRSGLLVAFAAFAALDILDGWLARRQDEETRLGAWLDGSFDSVAAVVLALAAERLGGVPLWLALLVVARVAMPWLVLGFAYFAAPRWLPERPSVRAAGLAARLPAIAAGAGIGMSLAGIDGGVPVATVGVVGSLVAFTITVRGQIDSASVTNAAPS